MDEETDAGHDQQHDQRKMIEVESEICVEVAGANPGGDRFRVGRGQGREMSRDPSAMANAAPQNASAIPATVCREKRLPSKPLMAAPTSGSTGISQRWRFSVIV